MFTWNSIGIIDEQSLIAITGEAWLRQPTTVRKCCAVGPSGGTGGDCCIDDPIPEGAQIKMIRVHHSDRIDAIGISYEVNGETVDLMHGGTGGTEDKFVLNPDEYVMGVYWCFGNIIDSITIVTNQRESPLYGGPGGNAHYCYVLGSDMEIVGFLGRAKKAIDAIGCVFRARPA